MIKDYITVMDIPRREGEQVRVAMRSKKTGFWDMFVFNKDDAPEESEDIKIQPEKTILFSAVKGAWF